MNKLILCVLLCVVGVAVAAPNRPIISPVFHADVSVSIRIGEKAYRGGGVYAWDVKANRARTDYRLEDEHVREKYIFIHELQRYDLHATYTIEEEKCHKTAVTGQIANPWEFVSDASFVGTSTYRGQSYDEWQTVDGNLTTRIAVLSSDTSKPVFLVYNDAGAAQTDIIFEEFDTRPPEDWVFYVPHFCENATKAELVGGDANAVVYFANANWNCANVACSSRVPEGTGQPGYACAEFTARSLAAGSFLPGLSSTAAQGSYSNYKGHNLCVTTGLASALTSLGFKSGGTVRAASALFGNAGEGSFSHACVGVGANLVDCHNNARQGKTSTWIMIKGINEVLSP